MTGESTVLHGAAPRDQALLRRHGPMNPISCARKNASACCVGDYIYVIGGTAKGYVPPTPLAMRLPILADRTPSKGPWEPIANPQIPRFGAATAVVDGRIYVIGGTGAQMITDFVERYDPARNSWSVLAAMPTRRTDAGCVADGRQIHVFGGYVYNNTGGSSPSQVHEIFDPTQGPNGTWRAAPAPMPERIAGQGCVLIGRKAYLVGGAGGDWAYDLDSHLWSRLSQQMPAVTATRLSSRATVAVGRFIYVFGSMLSNNRPYDSRIFRYDTQSGEWSIEPKAVLRSAQGCASIGAASAAKGFLGIYVMGGARLASSSDPVDASEYFLYQILPNRLPAKAAPTAPSSEQRPADGESAMLATPPTAIYDRRDIKERKSAPNSRLPATTGTCALVLQSSFLTMGTDGEATVLQDAEGNLLFPDVKTLEAQLNHRFPGVPVNNTAFPYTGQRCLGYGTAFLVSPSVIATAAHNFYFPGDDYTTEIPAAGIYAIFDWAIAATGTQPPTAIPQRNISYVKLLKRKFVRTVDISGRKLPLGSTDIDWALLQLVDNAGNQVAARPEYAVAPIALPEEGPIDGSSVWIVGHPEGLPAKYTSGGHVRAKNIRTFLSDTDAFKGNSGSPAFNTGNRVVGLCAFGPAENWEVVGRGPSLKVQPIQFETRTDPDTGDVIEAIPEDVLVGYQRIDEVRQWMDGNYQIRLLISEHDSEDGNLDSLTISLNGRQFAVNQNFDPGVAYEVSPPRSIATAFPSAAYLNQIKIRKEASTGDFLTSVIIEQVEIFLPGTGSIWTYFAFDDPTSGMLTDGDEMVMEIPVDLGFVES